MVLLLTPSQRGMNPPIPHRRPHVICNAV
uniref:Uncharacterized protein n=1 Tax=Arundo donax TaxID=35708 RepID=A0A0A9C5V9_ARUDO